jgi:hypothetical protein
VTIGVDQVAPAGLFDLGPQLAVVVYIGRP